MRHTLRGQRQLSTSPDNGSNDIRDSGTYNRAPGPGATNSPTTTRAAQQPAIAGNLSSTGRRNAMWSVTVEVGSDDWALPGCAAVVVEARPEGGPERR